MMIRYDPALLYEKDGCFRRNTSVIVNDGKIIEVAPTESLIKKYPQAAVQDWSGLVLVPGTVNAHNHSFQSLLRGVAVDRPFLEWRDRSLYKYSPKMTVEDIYTGALFAFAEMMKCGATTVSDFFYLHNFGLESDEAVIQAAKDIGIRLVLARTMYDWDGAPQGYVETVEQAVKNTKSLATKYAGNSMVTVLPAPHSLHAASPEMITAGCCLAKELGTKFHIHVAEEPFEVKQVQKEHGGLRPVEYLHTLGVVNQNMVIIHGVWLEENEIRLLGESNACLAYCPSSNMFLADGITNIPEMMKAGVTIGLGSDGACGNSRISVFEEMRMTALLQKANTLNAMSVNFKQVFQMGTENGGILTGLAVGSIKENCYADFVGIDLHDLSMQPVGDNLEQLLPNIVYSMQPSAIKKVVVNGKLTVDNGQLVFVKEDKIVHLVEQSMMRLNA